MKQFYALISYKHLLKSILFLLICITKDISADAKITFQDSLYQAANNPETPLKNRYEAYDRLIYLLRTKDNFSFCYQVNQQFIALTKENKDYTELTNAYMHLSMIYNNQAKYVEMQNCIDSASFYYQKAKSPTALVYLNFAKLSRELSFNRNAEVVKLSMNIIPIAEKYHLNFILSRIYNNLYMIYEEWSKFEQANNYQNKSELYANATKEINFILYCYSDRSDLLVDMMNTKNHAIFVDSIFKILDQSFDIVRTYPDQVSNFVLSTLYESKAEYLINYKLKNKDQKDINEIERNLDSALTYCPKKQNNCLNIIANIYAQKAKIAHLNNNPIQEESYLLQAYQTQLMQSPLNFMDLDAYLDKIVSFYKTSKNYEKALAYQEKLINFKEKQFNQTQAKAAQRYEAEFQSEKKDRLLKEFELKDDNRKKMMFLYLGLLILGIVGAFYIYKSIKLKLQVSLATQKQLQSEKHEQELQIKFEKEERQRLKTEQDLLALQQQKLQTEILANRLQLHHKNEVLRQIKDNIHSENSVNIAKILREESMVDKDFENAVFQIEEVHPNFFKSLNEKSVQKLTPLDLKYCAYIYLGMNAKQIGNLLNVESKSVRMTKYRLKQKIGFATETTLEDFLKTIA
ncbi:helix-turn-helix transcriptional regulator [Rhizosphaericola mali]|uniref:HTH luxR-type domain-containing protein n=1 Tax=Rhizosphaericola mali TaxID=2545455 RepID=A0A5P2GFS9_9BACT|nr:hypothetical protein [Rhizosphaericola mali]QES90491.1 hypothetical protein E0W69_018125 [Rhizosphaericola mali]